MLILTFDRICASALARAGVFGLACFAGAELGHVLSFSARDQAFVTFRPPAGFCLAVLLLINYRLWPAMLLAAGVADLASDVLLHNYTVPASLGFCVAHLGEACIGAWLLRRFVGVPFTLARVKDVLGLACLSALVSTLFGATVGAGVVKLAFSAVSYASAWQSWWLADIIGVLIFAPVALTWTAGRPTFLKSIGPWRIVESVALFLGLVLVTQGVYGELLPLPLTVPILILPFLLWAAFRFGPKGAATAVLVVALVGVWNTSQGRGPFTIQSALPSQQVLKAQGALGVFSLSVLLLAAAVAERKQAEQRRMGLMVALEQAFNEIKTLRGLIPLCAWCKKIRDDQGFWQGLEDYLSAHTEAQFTHGICPHCQENEIVSVRLGSTTAVKTPSRPRSCT